MEKIVSDKVKRSDVVFGYAFLGAWIGVLLDVLHLVPTGWITPVDSICALIGGIIGWYITKEEISTEKKINEILQKTFDSQVHVFDSTMTKEERNKKFDELFRWED